MSVNNGSALALGRTPHGVRGLKSAAIFTAVTLFASHPSRGAWIEISESGEDHIMAWSHPSRGAWIEISP